MTLFKTSFYNGIAVVIKMLSLLGINKVLAISIGPAGYALIGQFQNIIQITSTFASGAINTGIIRYTAEHAGDDDFLKRLWGTAGRISLIGSLFTTVIIIIFSRELAEHFLNARELSGVFVWFALSLIFFVFNNYLLAILNGKKELKTYVAANIFGSLISIVIVSLLTFYWKLYGALISLAVYQSLAFFVTLALVYPKEWFSFKTTLGVQLDRKIARSLLHYTIMALASAIFVPLSHILIRDLLGRNLGWNQAGIWEGMWRLSTAYLMLATSILSVYYLPRLSELKEVTALNREIKKCVVIITPFVAFAAAIVYALRTLIVDLLFSPVFQGMTNLFLWQLVGDTLKISSWLLAFVFVAKGYTLIYVLSEFVFAASFYIFVAALLPRLGLEATAVAHAINYGIYLIFVVTTLKLKRVL